MSKYIDRDELYKKYSKEAVFQVSHDKVGEARGLIMAMKMLMGAESVEAIPVVRCAECRHSEPYLDSQSVLTCRERGCTVPQENSAMKEGEKVMAEWISVKDRLPEDDSHVLCCTVTKKGTKNIIIGYYMDGVWRCGMNSNVSHWMPIPEPPKGENNG